MDKCRLGVFQFLSDIASKAEVRVLIDSTGNQTWNVGDGPKDMGEGIRERRCRLYGSEMDLADVITTGLMKIGNHGRRRDTYDSLKPKVALTWLYVICLEILVTFS